MTRGVFLWSLCPSAPRSKKKSHCGPPSKCGEFLKRILKWAQFLKRSEVGICVCPAVAPGCSVHMAVMQKAEQAGLSSTRTAFCR